LRTLVALLLAVLCTGLFWLIGSPTYVHPDEQFYTNSAIQMVHTGEYWTPFYPDGRLRLEKPILTYWAVAASFHVFGINLFASRFPSALAGVLVVCLTYQLARTITASRPVAILAAAIIAGNVESLIVCTRATPDALLCLFTLVSIWGIARVLFQQDQSCVGPLLAFGGMGLAVQTKVLPGLWPLGAIAGFWIIGKPERRLTKKLLHWPAITLGITMAVFWYAVMFHLHGSAAFRNQYEDQLGSYVTFKPLEVLRNVAAYVWGGLQNFLPWALLLLAMVFGQRAALAAFWRDRRPLVLFALIPTILLIAAFSCGNIRGQRYLTPALPPLAILVASLLVNVPVGETVWKWARRVVWFAAGLGILAGMGLLLAAGTNGCVLLIAGGSAMLAVGIAGVTVLRKADRLSCWVWVAGLIATTFLVGRGCLEPVVSRQALPALAKRLLQQSQSGTRVYTWQVRPSRAGLLRVLTEGKVPITELQSNGELPDLSGARLVVTTSPYQSLLHQAGYDVAQIEPDRSACPWLQHLAQQLWPKRVKKETSARETYWLATRSSPGAQQSHLDECPTCVPDSPAALRGAVVGLAAAGRSSMMVACQHPFRCR